MLVITQILLVSLLAVAMFFYLPKRLVNLFGIKRRWWHYLIPITVCVLGLVALNLVSTLNSVLIDRLYLISTAMMGFLFYLLVSLAIIECVLFCTKIKKQKAGIAVFALATVISVYGIWNAYQFRINKVDVEIEGLKKSVSVVVLADLQIGGHRGKSWLDRSVETTNGISPDLVLIPGDLVDSNTAVNRNTLASLKNLKAPAYFVTGNHDVYVGELKLKNIIADLGIRVLENDVVKTPGNLQLAGLKFMNADDDSFDLHPSEDKQTIKDTLEELAIDSDKPTIVMHHSPVGENYVEKAGADLYIAGHTHSGGQVFPATIVACAFFYNYCNGLYDYKNLKIFVSQGLGTFTLPMRVGTENELDVLRLTPKKH